MKSIKAPRRFVVCALALASAACLGGFVPKPSTPAPVDALLIEDRDAEFVATCAAIYRAQLGEDIGQSRAAECLDRCRRGSTGDDVATWLRSTPEYAERQARIERERVEAEARAARFRGRQRATPDGFVDAQGDPYNAVWLGPTVTKMSTAARASFLDFAADADGKPSTPGFNGVIGFFGRITWPGYEQSVEDSIAALPAWLAETRARNQYLVVIAITDSRGGGYDELAHLKRIATMTAAAENVFLIVANEPYHGTQSAIVNDLRGLCAAAKRVLAGYPNPWALGAGFEDAPVNGGYSGACGTFSTVHVGRSGTPADILKRMVGLAQIAGVTGGPVVSGEMIGAAEKAVRGKRLSDATFFGDAGHVLVSLGVGGGGFHSEDGLHGRVPGPKQRKAAQAFIDGSARTPKTIPIPPVGDPCVASNIDTPKEIVACERAKYGRLSRADVVEYMRASIRQLNRRGIDGAPFGLAVKTGGNTCVSYSCDVICSGQGPGQRQWDLVSDFEGDQSAVFHQVPPEKVAVRVCEAVR